MSDQDTLASAVAVLTTFVVDVEAEVAAIQSQPGAAKLDFSGLTDLLARVKVDDTVVNAITTSATPPVTPPVTTAVPDHVQPAQPVPSAPVNPSNVLPGGTV